MNLFFDKNININMDYKFVVGDLLKVKYFDEYKYLHFIEGVCLLKRKTKRGDLYVLVYDKTKGFYFSFFLNSPLVVSIFKKKLN